MFAVVTAVKRRAHKDNAMIQWSSAAVDMATVFDSTTDDRWREAFAPLVKGVVTDAANHWSAETGLSFSVRHLQAEDWFNNNTLKFVSPINKTSERELAALLQQADREGWTVTQTQKAITGTFNQWMHGTTDAATFAGARLPPYRTEMIARTVSMQSYNSGSTELYRDQGVQQREWLATNDNRTRDTHAEANGQVVGIDEPFIVGGYEMMFPGDDSGGAALDEIVNCRCNTIPVLDDVNGAIEGDTGAVDENGEPILEPEPQEEAVAPALYEPPDPADYAKLNDWSMDDITTWGLQQATWIDKNLTPEESQAVRAYTGTFYTSINGVLRGTISDETIAADPTLYKNVARLTSAMDSAFDKASVDQDLTLYRGVKADVFPDWKDVPDDMLPGMAFTDDGFFSASTDMKTMANWGGSYDKYELTVLVPEGTSGIYVPSISRFPRERELLLNRGETYRVISATTDTTKNVRRLTVEIVND